MSTLTTTGRRTASVVLLAVEIALAILAVILHYAFIAEYGVVTDNSFQGLIWGLKSGLSGIAIGVVAIVAVIAFLVSSIRSMRLASIAVLILTLMAMFAVTPLALQQKIDGQAGSTHKYVSE